MFKPQTIDTFRGTGQRWRDAVFLQRHSDSRSSDAVVEILQLPLDPAIAAVRDMWNSTYLKLLVAIRNYNARHEQSAPCSPMTTGESALLRNLETAGANHYHESKLRH